MPNLLRTTLFLVALCTSASAQSPTLATLVPSGGQRGTEVIVTAYGSRIGKTEGVFFYEDGIELAGVEPIAKNDNAVGLRLRIADDCKLGEHPLRLRTDRGVTSLRLFHVGTLREIQEKDANDSLDQAQPVPLESTVNGLIQREDRDWYAIDAPAATRVKLELQGVRLGVYQFDGYLSVHDANGHVVTECDDTAFGRMDPLCSFVSEVDATYYVQVREASNGGTNGSLYRLHVGTFPRPTGAIPSGGRAGTEVEVRLVGDGEPYTAKARLPKSGRHFEWFPTDRRGTAPTPVRLSLFGAPNVVEGESDMTEFKAPAALGGVLAKDGEADRFCFHAEKDERFSIRAITRDLRSPVDPVLTVTQGKNRSANDDNNGRPDSVIDFRARETGECVVLIHDHLWRGGEDFFYRIEVSRTKPDNRRMRTRTSLRRDAEWIAVPRSGRMMTVVTATNPVEGARIVLDGLPPGVTATSGVFAPGATSVPVVLEAAADARLDGAQVRLRYTAPGIDDAKDARYSDYVGLVRVLNNRNYLGRRLSTLPVAITERAPFEVTIEPPTVPIVQGGPLTLRVKVTRDEGFQGDVRVRLAWLPPGVRGSDITIRRDKDEGLISLSASSSARPGSWQIAGYGHSSINRGTLRCGTQLTTLEVASCWMTAEIGKTRGERGATTELPVTLTRAASFEGTGKARLVNLPRGVSAPVLEVAATTEGIEFPITIDTKAAAGRHRPLLRLDLPSPGGDVVHYFRGGDLRIDDPLPKRSKPATAAPRAETLRGSVSRPKT